MCLTNMSIFEPKEAGPGRSIFLISFKVFVLRSEYIAWLRDDDSVAALGDSEPEGAVSA